MTKYIVTIAPPTPNGDLHLGHLAGPYLAADICARALRQQGHEVLLLSYSDDYQSYLLRKSRETGEPAEQIALRNAKAIQNSLKSAGIELDAFMQAHANKNYLDEVNRYFSIAEQQNVIVRRTADIPYCGRCGVHGYEGFGRATCNFCGHPSDASQCEACGSVPEISKMGEMKCTLCGEPMAPVTVERLVWKIGETYSALKRRYENANLRRALADYLEKTLSRQDDEWPLTRPGEAAIPLYRHPDQPIHTWFAGLPGYRATLIEYLNEIGQGDCIDEWWNPSTRIAQFLGLDCAYSHAVGYAALMEYEENAPREQCLFTNMFLKLNGEDFSTSRNHAIWIRDIVHEYPIDAIRLYAALKSPENQTDDFNEHHFKTWVATQYVPEIENGTWRRQAAAGEGFGPSDETRHKCADFVARWERAKSLESFSIGELARIQLELLSVIRETPIAEHDYLWGLFQYLGEAVHPNLSEEISRKLSDSPYVPEQWLKAAALETTANV